jgi:hypothetical protein
MVGAYAQPPKPVLFTQAEQPVGRGLARLDAQSLLQVAQNIVTAAQGATEVGAHMQAGSAPAAGSRNKV